MFRYLTLICTVTIGPPDPPLSSSSWRRGAWRGRGRTRRAARRRARRPASRGPWLGTVAVDMRWLDCSSSTSVQWWDLSPEQINTLGTVVIIWTGTRLHYEYVNWNPENRQMTSCRYPPMCKIELIWGSLNRSVLIYCNSERYKRSQNELFFLFLSWSWDWSSGLLLRGQHGGQLGVDSLVLVPQKVPSEGS